MDEAWVLEQLDSFIAHTVPTPDNAAFDRGGLWSGESSDTVVGEWHVVEQIVDAVIPGWRSQPEPETDRPGWERWSYERHFAIKARAEVAVSATIREKLGDTAPKLSASSMHPWIWDAARSLWQSRHFRHAVSNAAVKVNAETQNKLGRRDISETDLLKQALSDNEASADSPRLRLAGDDGGRTAQNVRRGARAFAEGCFAAIRNPASHDYLDEMAEAEALEQLAAFSLLARWVDGATIDRG